MGYDADFAELVRAAHGDAWQALGSLFEARGGGSASLPGLRLMASGLPHPQWNSADVCDAAADIEAARSFYAAYGVPWGVRVPAGMAWRHGRRLFRQRLMGLFRRGFRAAPTPRGLTIDAADPADLDALLAVDVAAFGSDGDLERPWLSALVGAPPEVVTVVRATVRRKVVGTGYSVIADGEAGPSVYIAGISVLPAHRERGVGGAVSTWLVERGFSAGAELAHLHPDDDRAARLYARLGFVETRGLDVYVDVRGAELRRAH
jgi:ribosomal protein S18 acetylase RimI-like enzyme